MKRNIDSRKISRILIDRRRASAGFTLSETVIVISIILVLMTLAVPGLLSLRRNLTITRLDETAKEIYAAAQNTLTRLDNSALSGSLAGTKMTDAPADYNGASWDIAGESFFYADQDSGAAKELLPLGSIEAPVRSGGRYIIEYNLKTASIYSVFYADSDFDYSALAQDAGFRGSREERRSALVGYYGGTTVERDDFERCASPSITVDNSDVLRLTISGFKPGEYSMRIVLADLEKHSMELSYPSAAQPSNLVLNPDYTFTLTLDSLEGERFAALCPGLTPGSDIDVTVYFEKPAALSSYSSVTVNSLFASREGGKAAIGYSRHLQNLDASYSGVSGDITAAEQTANITWGISRDFESIRNDALKAYDGNQQRISALSSSAGLFETLSGAELRDIHIVNSKVHSVSASPAGSLAGELDGCTVSGCQVYSYLLANGGVNYEGYGSYGLSASGSSGGLIGSVSACTVSDSFAALPYLNGALGSAGLIGTARNSSVTNCYSACDSFSGSAMLIADADAASVVDNCYAVGNSSAALAALPFVSGGSVKNSYCAFSYLNAAVKNFATDYLVYDGSGTLTRTNADQLSAAISGSWGSSSAAVTRPYSRALDGRAYPYKSVPGMRHCGSWPLEGGLMVTVQLKLESGEDAFNAGAVTIQRADTGETLYDSDNLNMANPVEIPVGIELVITVSANSGYSYRYSQFTGSPTVTLTPFKFTPQSDTTLTVLFSQTAFTLTAAAAENENGAAASSYRVTAGSVSMLPVNERRVYTGTKVLVTPEAGSEYFVKGVRYETSNGTAVEVKRDGDGNFSFAMPGSDTTIYVTYTKKYVLCNIYCHRMDEDGGYNENVSISDSIRLGIGETINEELIAYLAGRSNIPVTINGVKCIALDNQKTTLWKIGKNKTEQLEIPYTTLPADETTSNQNKSLSIHLYFARSQHKVTLVSGDNISSVRLGSGTPDPIKTEATLYFGKNITAVAAVSGNVEFTEWKELNGAFTGSGNPSYSFAVPSYDIILEASAVRGYRQITLDLYKNGNSWPLHGQTLYLQNKDTGKLFLMDKLTDPTCSFRSQKSVPAGVYRIRVGAADGEYYTAGLSAPVELDCTNRPVNGRLDYYTVSFNPNATRYSGSVPSGGVYPKGHVYIVPGNSDALRRNDNTPETMFSGWYDAYVDALNPTAYDEGDSLTISGKLAFFAKWQSGLSISYDANAADGGELPYDAKTYSSGDSVTLKFPSSYAAPLYRTGYSFVGWRDSNDGSSGNLYIESGARALTFGGVNIILYAQWQKNSYSVGCYDESGRALTGSAYESVIEHDGSFTLPIYAPSATGNFIGWATEKNGAVRYAAGDKINVTADTQLYAIVADETVSVSYYYDKQSHSVTVGKNTPFYLSFIPSGVSSLIGWSTSSSYSGEIYRCDGNGVSLAPVSFDGDTSLYALSGRVHNSTLNTWHETLSDAVSNAKSDNSLVVYADTLESGQISISKDLFITADGARTVSWKNSASLSSFYGCLTISGTVCLGSNAIDSAEMSAGNSLTFDAAQKGRVVMLSSGARLYMYDGVTLTNGLVALGTSLNLYGGGVLAKSGSGFYMRGGTVSYSSAYYGGGVYLASGSRMEMGRMMHPGAIGQGYMEGGLYYRQAYGSSSVYEIDESVDASNYSSSFVPWGSPSISFNTATRVQNNTSDMSAQSNGGGGLFLENLDQDGMLLYSGEISFNSANANGGGILTDSNGDNVLLRIYEVDISHNAANNGGGIFQWQGTVFIYNSVISQNYARNNGGGICLTANRLRAEKSAIEFCCGDVTGNQAGSCGGAMYIRGKTSLQMYGGNLIGNHAPLGGAVYVDYDSFLRSGGLFELSGGYISGNDNGSSGDIYLADNTAIHVPAGYVLNLERPSYAQDDDRIVVACDNATDGRTVLSYDAPSAFLETDANFFFYADRAAYTVFPSSDSAALLLRTETGKRSVSFDENRSGAPVPQSLEYTIGTDILSTAEPVSPAPPKPAVPGKKFMGWAQRADAAASELLTSYTVTELFAQTLYAIWDDYQISYDVSGAPSTVIVPPAAHGPTVTLPELKSSDGKPIIGYNDTNTLSYTYTFVGWSKTPGSDTAEYHAGDVIGTTQSPMTEDLTLYAVWTKTQTPSHNVSFKPNEGDGIEHTVPVSEGLMLKAKPAYYFTRDGHDFTGWNTAPDGSGTAYAADSDITMGTADIDLYAQWQIKTYLVSYELAGGTSAEPLTPQTYEHGAPLTLPAANPYRDHYSFTGWFDGEGAQYPDGYQVKADLTLYAGWNIDIFTVSYDKNGGSGSIGASSVEWDGSLVLPSAGAGIVRSGYALSSWNTMADGSGSSYEPGGTLSNVSASVTLFAQWTKLHTLRFYSNYDTNAELSPAQTVLDGESLTLPDAPVREGFTFAGWSTDPAATVGEPGMTTVYPAADTDYYVIWIDDAAP